MALLAVLLAVQAAAVSGEVASKMVPSWSLLFSSQSGSLFVLTLHAMKA